jgi:hypothetical protein
MKKIYIPIFISFYAVWLVAGFFFAKNLWLNSNEIQVSNEWRKTQQTVLIIQVDDLTSSRPELVSTWALFSDFSGAPTLAFKALFPAPAEKVNENLAKSFNLTANKEPTPQFIKSLEVYEFKWNSVIVVDQVGAQSLYRWVSQPAGKTAGADDASKGSVRNQAEVSLFQSVCSHLESASNLPDLALEWARLVPDHLHTNISLETFSLMWGKMITTDRPVHCEALP